MPSAVEQFVRTLRTRVLLKESETLSDRALLEAFADDGDEAAFAEIVRRHGPLVLGVCRRILGNAQDAEDAFQAVFLVLARKAGRLDWHESIKNWLHGVAYRVACKARGQAHRRAKREKQAGTREASTPGEAWTDLRCILDEELEHLPAKYRAVLLLCYLEGKTRDEAAEQLGWTVGSVKGYLERGREMLRLRLARRGLALSAALAAGLLSGTSAQAALPAALIAATAHSACHFVAGSAMSAGLAGPVLSLAQGALNAMLIAKIKTTALIALMLCVGAGALSGLYYASAERPLHAATAAQERKGGERKGDEEKRAARNPDESLGLIKDIDLKIGTLTLAFLRDGERGEHTFGLADKNLKVTTNLEQTAKLSDLTVGLRVHATIKGKEITAIRAEHPIQSLFVTDVDAEKKTIGYRVVRVGFGKASVAADAKITANGRPIKLAEVRADSTATATFSLDKKTVLALQVGPPVRRDGDVERPVKPGARDGDRPAARDGLTQGIIVDFDAAKGTINLLVGREAEAVLHTLSVGKDAKIKLFYGERPFKDLTVANLAKPLPVSFQLSDDKKSATLIHIQPPTVRGVVKSVDAAKKTITITEARETEKTYTVEDGAIIRGPREGGGIADVPAGANVLLSLTPDRQRAIGVAITVRRGDGR